MHGHVVEQRLPVPGSVIPIEHVVDAPSSLWRPFEVLFEYHHVNRAHKIVRSVMRFHFLQGIFR